MPVHLCFLVESNQCLTAMFPLSTRSLMPMMKSHQCLRNTGNKKTSSWDGRLQAESKLLPSCSVLKKHQQLLVGSIVLASWLSVCVCVCVLACNCVCMRKLGVQCQIMIFSRAFLKIHLHFILRFTQIQSCCKSRRIMCGWMQVVT